jgi:hypothetical protein
METLKVELRSKEEQEILESGGLEGKNRSEQ